MIHGDYGNFEFKYIKELPEYRSKGIRLIHKKTGADIFHLYNEDRENLFSFSFKTPPRDDTGVAHIVEHSVLAGSRRFRIKEPFLAMLNRSMNTFLNAMTFPDKTVYPASSTVEKDFFNLMLVYGDAVFFPLLRKETFMHEAYHYAINGGLKISGVVFNEMKGAYSDPDSIVESWTYRSLLKDTAYRYESGGYPPAIPDLTYEDFLDFHRRYYHPSNCRIFLYGNIPTEKHLDFLEKEFLSHFSAINVSAELGEQKRWNKPVRIEKTYPIAKGSDPSGKTTVLLNWLTVPVSEPVKLLSMEILSEILIGNAGSPLRKRLVESRLGEDLSPVSGLESELRDVIFSVGLRGTERERAPQIERLVMDTLKELAETGIPEKDKVAAIHRVEFRNREIRGGGAPFALRLMRRSLRGWLHDYDPELTLEFKNHMDKLLSDMEKGFRFEEFLGEYLAENPHRSTLVVYPDPEYRDRVSEEISEKERKIEEGIKEEERKALKREAERLEDFLEKPDSPEDVEKLPSLNLKDVPGRVEIIPTEKVESSLDVDIYYHDIFTNGIVYIDLGIDVTDIEEKNAIYLPVLSRAICKSGLPGIGYDEVALELARYTGGFYSNLLASSVTANNEGKVGGKGYLFFRLKALKKNFKVALELVEKLLKEADFTDTSRIRDIVVEMRNDFKSSLIPSGHIYSMSRAESGFSEAAKKSELWGGITQYLFTDSLVSEMDKNIEAIVESLEVLRGRILGKIDIVNVTVEEELRNDSLEIIEAFLKNLPQTDEVSQNHKGEVFLTEYSKGFPGSKLEVLTLSSKVGYVAHSIRGERFGNPDEPHYSVLAHLLRTGYLWENVRMKGGAYGAFALHNGSEGVFTFCSYRDPNIVSTVDAYRNAFSYVEREVTNTQVRDSIIGTVGREEKPLDPGERGFQSLKRSLFGITDEMRQDRRERILKTSQRDLNRISSKLYERFVEGKTVIISGMDIVEREAENMSELTENIVKLP